MNKHQARHYCTLSVLAAYVAIWVLDDKGPDFRAAWALFSLSTIMWFLARWWVFTSDKE